MSGDEFITPSVICDNGQPRAVLKNGDSIIFYNYRGDRPRALTEYQKAINTGDDAYGAQADAKKYLNEPFRRTGKPTLGD